MNTHRLRKQQGVSDRARLEQGRQKSTDVERLSKYAEHTTSQPSVTTGVVWSSDLYKYRPEMTHNMSSGILNLAQPTNQPVSLIIGSLILYPRLSTLSSEA